jgi:prepilin-type N-terminal cleavage/methylation domain-containing protein
MDRGKKMRNARTGGFTLLEVLMAMAVLLIGAVGMLSLHLHGIRMEADARKSTRAAAIAQDLMDQISIWSWGDARLGGANPPLDATHLATLGDPAYAYEGTTPPSSSFADTSGGLTASGALPWLGIPLADTQALGFERYWNVAYVDDSNGNGVPDAARIAVIVRYPVGIGYRRVVLLGIKPNPAEAR